MQNRAFGPYLITSNRILISVTSGAAAACRHHSNKHGAVCPIRQEICVDLTRRVSCLLWSLWQVMDALNMWWEDDSFDLVWACESGEHMPDKRKYVEEMARVLKPGQGAITESNRMELVLSGVQNRTFGPYLAAINRINRIPAEGRPCDRLLIL
jgi:SAM-dependent methyltransferase